VQSYKIHFSIYQEQIYFVPFVKMLCPLVGNDDIPFFNPQTSMDAELCSEPCNKCVQDPAGGTICSVEKLLLPTLSNLALSGKGKTCPLVRFL